MGTPYYMPKERVVTWGEVKPPKHKFKDKKCPECRKKYVLDQEWGEWCWYCGKVISENDKH